MLKVIIILILSFILMLSVIYFWSKLLERKIDFKNYKLYIAIVGMMSTSLINFFAVNDFIRITIITIFFAIFFKYLFNESLNKTIVTPVYSQVIVFICEALYAMVLSILFSDNIDVLINSVLGNLATNLVISAMIVAVAQFKFIKKIYNKILKSTDKINSVQLSLLCIFGMLILNVLIISSYYKIEFQYFLSINVATTILVFAIIFYLFKTQNKYNKVSNKYNIAIKSLNDYETMMTKYRVANHENKNMLLTVRAMIVNKDKDIPKYIDSIIEDKYSDDEKLLFKVSTIPSGGLRATIYSEILKIKENKINYDLNIDKEVKTVDLIELDTSTIIDTCKIIGVFIDNSIEAVEKLNEKYINIELYVEDKKLCIKVSNNYSGKINIDKINNEGYTTKGKGHGYGLSLVKNIINNNQIFEHQTNLSKTVFSQILKIKY